MKFSHISPQKKQSRHQILFNRYQHDTGNCYNAVSGHSVVHSAVSASGHKVTTTGYNISPATQAQHMQPWLYVSQILAQLLVGRYRNVSTGHCDCLTFSPGLCPGRMQLQGPHGLHAIFISRPGSGKICGKNGPRP